jgi:hypothetical protein
MKSLGVTPRTWQLWERPAEPRPFQLQRRDIEILYQVFRHRFLQPRHVHVLLGGSEANLAVRLRLLWQHRCLERPRALRPTRVLTEEIVYGLGREGARLLERYYPQLRIAHLDWAESPKKQIGLPYIDHQLGIAAFMVALKAACARRGVIFHWRGHQLDNPRIETPVYEGGGAICPDAHFGLEVPGAGTANHFLEMDRGNVSLARMAERYQCYFAYWRDVAEEPDRQFRVVTMTDDEHHMASLRRIARKACPINSESWKALLFTSARVFTLNEPERILEPVFWYPDGGPVSLLAGAEQFLAGYG